MQEIKGDFLQVEQARADSGSADDLGCAAVSAHLALGVGLQDQVTMAHGVILNRQPRPLSSHISCQESGRTVASPAFRPRSVRPVQGAMFGHRPNPCRTN